MVPFIFKAFSVSTFPKNQKTKHRSLDFSESSKLFCFYFAYLNVAATKQDSETDALGGNTHLATDRFLSSQCADFQVQCTSLRQSFWKTSIITRDFLVELGSELKKIFSLLWNMYMSNSQHSSRTCKCKAKQTFFQTHFNFMIPT